MRKVLRAGICLLLAFAVASYGAVETWSGSLVEIGSALLLAVWAISALLDARVDVRWDPLNWPLLAFCGVGAAQLLFHVTAYPFLTRVELLCAVACWIVFFLTTQAFRTRDDLQVLAWFLVILCFAASLEAIIQFFTSGDKIYWFQTVQSGVKPFGPFVNRNHFAGFVELTLPTGLGLLMLRGIRRDLVPLMTLLTLVPISALVLSSSRGGIIGVCAALCVLAAFRWNRRGTDKLRVGPIVAAVAAAVLLIGWVGAKRAISRFEPGTGEEISTGKRISMTRGALHMFLDHPLMGTGLGTTVVVYPRYETMYDGRLVDHVHDDYAETLAETGLLGGACGVSFLILLFEGAREGYLAEQGHFSRALHAGAIAAVVGLLLHSFVDFNLHIFSNALLFLVQAALATAPAVNSASARVFHYGTEMKRSRPPENGT
ncbi:MAG TPA: O-antigen ligase family protein [Candidatus Aquilonibacter sp.]|nr:O-antigen ligase family protein [Candidatus Aquilonibacter sp.]